MTRRVLVLAGAFALALAGVASAAVLSVQPDGLTLVRIPGAVPAKTCTVVAIADAHIDEALPDANAGAAAALDLVAGPSDRWPYVRFDVSACGVPATAEVRSAALRMTLATAPAEDRSWKARRIAGAWTEGGLTWNTAPALAVASTDIVQSGTVAGATVTWNVAPDVAGVVSGAVADQGWRIVDADEAPVAPVSASLVSREGAAADRPSLTVTWFD